MFDQFIAWVSGAWWSYPVIFLVSMLDAFFPFVPSETVVITAGVIASVGDLSLPLVIVCASLGALVGDNISYGLGSLLGERRVKNACCAVTGAGAPSSGPSASSRCVASI